MEPQVNDHVKIIFHNGLIEEGVILEWSGTKAVLRSFSSENLLLIQNTDRDVLAIKVYRDEAQVGRANANSRVFVERPELQERVPQPDLRALKLAELQQLRIKEEQARARELLTTFQPSGLPAVKYGLPGKLGQPVLRDSAEEDRRRYRGYQEPLPRPQDRGAVTGGQYYGGSNSEVRSGQYPSGLLVPGYVRLPGR